MPLTIVVRGGGDLASGVVLRCARAGWRVFVLELPQPVAVRRYVSFAQAVFDGAVTIEGVTGVRTADLSSALSLADQGAVPVMVDPEMRLIDGLAADVLVDARMIKKKVDEPRRINGLTIGLGPGFEAGVNCDVVVETMRGPSLGRVYWDGMAAKDTGMPDAVGRYQNERVLRAPADGVVKSIAKIGDRVKAGDPILKVGDEMLAAPFDGVLRGVIQDGLKVAASMKVGDVDPRDNPDLCFLVSDKALAIGGGVLEAILSRRDLRERMWSP